MICCFGQKSLEHWAQARNRSTSRRRRWSRRWCGRTGWWRSLTFTVSSSSPSCSSSLRSYTCAQSSFECRGRWEQILLKEEDVEDSIDQTRRTLSFVLVMPKSKYRYWYVEWPMWSEQYKYMCQRFAIDFETLIQTLRWYKTTNPHFSSLLTIVICYCESITYRLKIIAFVVVKLYLLSTTTTLSDPRWRRRTVWPDKNRQMSIKVV